MKKILLFVLVLGAVAAYLALRANKGEDLSSAPETPLVQSVPPSEPETTRESLPRLELTTGVDSPLQTANVDQSAPMSQTAQSTTAVEGLKSALQQEDPCLVARLNLGSELDPVEAAQVLFEIGGAARTFAPEEIETMEALFRPNCTMPEGDQNPTALAYRAYCLAAHPEVEKDIPVQTRRLWNALRRREPRNGAHPFVWASYLLKRERAKGDAEPRGLLEQAMQLERFDLKRRGLLERIRELSSRNSAAALLGEQLTLLVPQPDLATATEYWSEALKKMPISEARPSLAWAQRLARRNWRRAQNGIEGIDWSIQEFESARKIGIEAWKRIRGKAPLPEEFLREPMDLIKRNPVESSKSAAMTALRSENCDRSAWDRLHEEQRRLHTR